jgi:hypothetical protein
MKLIINADDFGLTEKVNEGIIQSIQNGIVNSTTFMVNTKHFKKSIEQIKKYNIKTGIHINLCYGKPVSNNETVSSLTDKNGYFYKNEFQLIHLIKHKKNKIEHIKTEIYNQLSKLYDNGIKPTHIDSHKHIHHYLPVYNIITELADKFNIKKIRIAKDIDFLKSFNKLQKDNYYYFQWYINLMELTKKYNKLEYPEFMFFFYAGKLNKTLITNFINKYKNSGKTIELMCHPGLVDNELKQISSLTTERETELKTLTNQKLIKLVKTTNT